MNKRDADAVATYVYQMVRVNMTGHTHERLTEQFHAMVKDPPIPPPPPPPPPIRTGTVSTPIPMWGRKETVINAAWALVYGTEKTLADRVLALKAALIALEREPIPPPPVPAPEPRIMATLPKEELDALRNLQASVKVMLQHWHVWTPAHKPPLVQALEYQLKNLERFK